jgi:hypothetical protein
MWRKEKRVIQNSRVAYIPIVALLSACLRICPIGVLIIYYIYNLIFGVERVVLLYYSI